MEMSPELMERMDSYLEGRMSSDERVVFEQDLISSEELSKLFEEHQSMILAVQASSVQKSLKDVIQKNRNTAPHSARKRKLYTTGMSIAAVAMILLGAFFMLRPGADTTQQLFAQYYDTDPGLPTLMSGDGQVQFQNAMTAYKQGDYADALERFKTITASESNDTLTFYSSMCYLELEQVQESISLLGDIHPASAFYEKAQWYMALAHLQSKDFGQTRTVLKEIVANENHIFLESAKELLSELNQE